MFNSTAVIGYEDEERKKSTSEERIKGYDSFSNRRLFDSFGVARNK